MAVKAQERASLFERLELSLYAVETSSYSTHHVDRLVRPEWIVSHVLHGDVQTETSGVRLPARAGHVMIHPPGVAFSEQALPPEYINGWPSI